MNENPAAAMPHADAILDVSGHECPVPATQARRRLDGMAPGEVLEVIATDPLAALDLQILCDRLGHALLASRDSGDATSYWIRVSPAR